MFENVDGRTDAGVTGILLIAHLGAFGSGELKTKISMTNGSLMKVKIIA